MNFMNYSNLKLGFHSSALSMSKGFVLELDISCVQLYSTKLDLHNVLLLIGGLVVAAAAAGSAAASFSDIRDFP